jgi:hypothetical protein
MRLSPQVIEYLSALVEEQLKLSICGETILAQCQKELAQCHRHSRYKKPVPLEYSRKDW